MTKPQPLDLEETANRILKELSVISCIEDSKGIQYSIKSNIIFFVKQHLKSACEFYLRYKDSPGLLKDEAIKNKYILQISVKKIDQFLRKINESYSKDGNIEYWLDKYNEWLFKLAFKDVLEVK